VNKSEAALDDFKRAEEGKAKEDEKKFKTYGKESLKRWKENPKEETELTQLSLYNQINFVENDILLKWTEIQDLFLPIVDKLEEMSGRSEQ
jgi:hypothetical protein